MTMAITKAVEEGARRSSAPRPATPAPAPPPTPPAPGITCAVLVPQGKIAMGKLAQALVHGAKLLQVDGNFDDCLALASKLAIDYPVSLVNTVNPFRIEGQKTAAFEIVDVLGDAPDIHCLPVGNAGNITAYWQGYREYAADGHADAHPADVGLPGRRRRADRHRPGRRAPETIATAIRIGNPASWTKALDARDELGRPHRRRHRPRDPRRLPAAGPQRGGVRRAGVGRLGRRSAAGRRGRRARAGPAGRLHRHRQRPQGPGVGDLRRARAGDHPGRRRARPPPNSAYDRRCSDPAVQRPRPGDQRQPRAGVRLRRAGADLLRRPRVRRPRRRASTVEVTGVGAGELPTDESHLVVRAFRAACDELGWTPPGLRVVARQRHPAGAGDGLVGGRGRRRGGRRLGALPGRRRRSTTTRCSGWPPSWRATPTTSRPACSAGRRCPGRRPTARGAVRLDVAPATSARSSSCPAATLSTQSARGLLPDAVPHADAAFNAARSALLVHALTRDPALLLEATDDRLHQRQRAAAMPESIGADRRLRAAGLAAVVSGAGPSVLVLDRPGRRDDGALADLTPPGWSVPPAGRRCGRGRGAGRGA